MRTFWPACRRGRAHATMMSHALAWAARSGSTAATVAVAVRDTATPCRLPLRVRTDLSTCDACPTHTQLHCTAPARVTAATGESRSLLRECPLARQQSNRARHGSAAIAKLELVAAVRALTAPRACAAAASPRRRTRRPRQARAAAVGLCRPCSVSAGRARADGDRGGRFGGRSGGFGGSQDGSQDGDHFDPDAPARADMTDDWGKDRKFVSSGPGGDRGRDGAPPPARWCCSWPAWGVWLRRGEGQRRDSSGALRGCTRVTLAVRRALSHGRRSGSLPCCCLQGCWGVLQPHCAPSWR